MILRQIFKAEVTMERAISRRSESGLQEVLVDSIALPDALILFVRQSC